MNADAADKRRAGSVVMRVLSAIDGYVMAPAPAARLAALRILMGGFAMIYLFARLPHFIGYGSFNPGQFRPVGVVWLLCAQPLPSAAVTGIAIGTAGLSIAFVLGYRMRVIGPMFAAALLWTISYANSWGMVFHTENLVVLHVLILGVSGSGHALSLDARRYASLGRDVPASHGRYGWPIKLMCFVVVIAYVLAGVAKLKNGGVSWLWGDELRNHVAIDNARKILLGDISSPLAPPLMHWESLWRFLATLTVALELAAPIALLSRRLAMFWVIGVVGFHWGVLVLMMIVFPYQMTVICFACFFAAETWIAWARARWRRFRQRRRDATPLSTTE